MVKALIYQDRQQHRHDRVSDVWGTLSEHAYVQGKAPGVWCTCTTPHSYVGFVKRACVLREFMKIMFGHARGLSGMLVMPGQPLACTSHAQVFHSTKCVGAGEHARGHFLPRKWKSRDTLCRASVRRHAMLRECMCAFRVLHTRRHATLHEMSCVSTHGGLSRHAQGVWTACSRHAAMRSLSMLCDLAKHTQVLRRSHS